MAYMPKIIRGKVMGTGWPIDGRVLTLSMWAWDDYSSWHLWSWEDADDEAVMLTMYQSMEAADFIEPYTLEDFTAKWKAGEWDPPGVFCLDLDKVEVLEVLQQEEKPDTREKLSSYGYNLTPRKDTDRGGILCMPLADNLCGDVKATHPDWEQTTCPSCGRQCWKQGEADKLQREQGVQLLCTMCALKAGSDTRPVPNKPHPEGNRAQRRRAKRAGAKGI